MKKRSIKKVLMIVGVLVAVMAGVFFIAVQNQLQSFSKEISAIEINNIDLSSVSDGVYIGAYHVNELVGAILEVTVIDHQITKVNILEHQYGKGGKAEAIIDRVIAEQSLGVDVISGATGSSTVLLKAIDNALHQR